MDNIENINKVLKAKAMSLGLCREWTNDWQMDSDRDALVDKFKRGLDFCIEHNYPSNDAIKTFFDRDFLIKNHIYVDECLNVSQCESGIYVIQGESDINLTIGGYNVATIFVRHNSKVSITCTGYARVFVRLYDESETFVYQHNESKAFVKRHSENALLKTVGNITVKEKFNLEN